MSQLTLFIARLFGARYILNHRSLEVHKIGNLTRSCWPYHMTNFRFIWRMRTVKRLQHDNPEVNGCAHCFKELNTD